jgi:hypothetical protein
MGAALGPPAPVGPAEELRHEILEMCGGDVEGLCMPKASSLYVAILDDLKGIEWHTRQIAQKLAGATAA